MDYINTSFLTFMLSGETFAINVANVTEVLEMQPITKIPQTPDFMRGIINLRSDVIPVISLRTKLIMNEVADSSEMVIIIMSMPVNQKMMKIGAVADKVNEVMSIVPEEVGPLPDITSHYDVEFVRGIYKYNDDFMVLLDIDKVIRAALPSHTQNETANLNH
jgi:purine-binding chemotaxis protein CheW